MAILNGPNHSQGGSIIDRYLSRWFYAQGLWIAKRPGLVLILCVAFTILAALGTLHITFITSPQDLWVPKDAEVSIQKEYFDSHFGPFFRIEQIIVTGVPDPAHVNQTAPNVLTRDTMLWLYDLQTALSDIVITYNKKQYKLHDLCYKLMDGKPCMTTTVTEFFQNNFTLINSTQNPGYHVYDCSNQKFSWDECRMSSGVPMQNATVMGNAMFFRDARGKTYMGAQALLVTYLLLNGDTADIAMLWELEAMKKITEHAAKNKNIRVSYSCERSVQDEVNRETTSDLFTIAISYILMFVYVSLSIGKFHLVRSKFMVGFAGIIIVICSVMISVGICSLFGVHATLIISEVIPFLILAIGVDNMFILVNTIDQISSSVDVPQTIAIALSHVGSSMMLASLSEFLAFMLGSLTKMPAVQAFCLYAGVAVIFNFILQVTAFVAILTWDLRRIKSKRLDILPCVKANPEWTGENAWSVSSLIRWFMDKVFAPIVLFLPVCIALVVIFIIFSILSLVYTTGHIEMGLDQSTAVPQNSYLVNYFNNQTAYLAVGPPVYFVTEELNYTDIKTVDVMSNYYESIVATDYIFPGSSALWITDFYQWIKRGCSRQNITLGPDGSIPPDQFVPLLKIFIQSDCCHLDNSETPLCGFQYRYDISFDNDTQTGTEAVVASRIRSQTSVLRTQDDFINSMKASYATTSNETAFATFPYSVYYIYFAQYLYLPDIAAMNVIIAAVAVMVTTLILLSSPVSSAYILVCIMMINVNLLAIMGLWKIYFNALSVVNLVMSVGISVEFCVHIVNSFLNARGTHKERAHYALVEMGSSVVSGIFLTKLIGVIVLNFSQSEIFQIYYFRMYLSIVVLGCLHGLVFLPCLLALVGPNEKPVSASDNVGYTTIANVPSMESINPDNYQTNANSTPIYPSPQSNLSPNPYSYNTNKGIY